MRQAFQSFVCVVLVACSSGADRAASPTRAAPAPSRSLARWTPIDPPAEPGALGASLVATPNGVLATWLEPLGDAHRVRIARLRGDSWSAPATVVDSPELLANWADFPRAAQGSDGAIYVSYPTRRGSAAEAYDAVVARAPDVAGPFVALGTLHRDTTETEHGFVSMVPVGSGVRAFWLDGRATSEGGATAVFSADVGASIGPEQRIDERACDCCQTDAARSADDVLVTFRDRAEGEEIRDIALARVSGTGAPDTLTVHADRWHMAGCPVNGPAIDADGLRVVVAWFTGADGGAVRVAFGRPGEGFDAPIDVDAAQPPGRVDVALVDGGAAVSWLARAADGSGEVRVRYVGVSRDLGEATIVAPTSSLRAGGFPVMARDGDRLVVVHRDASEPPRVRVASLPVSALPRRASAAAVTSVAARIAVGDRLPASARISTREGESPLASVADARPLVVAFFARWCQPCREELALLEDIRVASPHARVIAVSVDEGPLDRAESTARAWGFGGEVARDAGAATALGVPPLPGVLVLGEGGTVRLVHVGRPVARAELEASLAP